MAGRGSQHLQAIPVKLKRFGLDVADAADQELDLALHAIRKKIGTARGDAERSMTTLLLSDRTLTP